MATDNTFLNDISVLEPLSSSDHNILIFKVNARTNFIDSPESELYYDFAAADYNAINRYLNSLNWSEIFSRSFTVNLPPRTGPSDAAKRPCDALYRPVS